ncbi:MAG: DUF5683 domain-containing protein [Candidatus Cloacimonetes bacterium]|nr:DUF5683 domain-containing protein [Candidatus Cloacimonadota bacterium]
MKRFILIILAISFLFSLWGEQSIEEMIFGPEAGKEQKPDFSAEEDLIRVNFQKKDARRAMLYSMILPGAGQFYADRSAITTWVFPVIEAAMIGGIVYYNISGNKKTDDFEHYATGETVTHTFTYTVNSTDYIYEYTGKRYDRHRQISTQEVLKGMYPHDIYDDSYFRLDSANTQHFYEDIGKYNKYIFGWADWYYNYATHPATGEFILDNDEFKDVWLFRDEHDQQHLRWEASVRIEDYLNHPTDYQAYGILPSSVKASPWRQEYIQMRKDANAQYANARLFTIGLAFNHLASALDAVRVANKVNKTYLTQSMLRFNYYATVKDGNLQPNMGLSLVF